MSLNRSTIIIAEAGVNHNGSLALAKKLVDAAAEAGVDYVKFQTFKAEHVISKTVKKAAYQIENTGNQEETQLEMVKKLELSFDEFLELEEYCKSKNIKFLSTGFDFESIDFLNGLGMDLLKIPSGEITNLPLLRKIGASNNHIVISTGMANMGEIEAALEVLIAVGTPIENITVLHCNTEYPTPYTDVNLKAMQTIGKAFGVNYGYSDHTLGIEIPTAAVALGATVIEKHFTLDKTMDGPDHRASLEPDELVQMVKAIRNIEAALGNGIKSPSQSEKKNIPIVRKSIHISKDLKAGQILSEKDIIMKRPGHGISPMLVDDIVGKKINKDLDEDYLLKWTDIIYE